MGRTFARSSRGASCVYQFSNYALRRKQPRYGRQHKDFGLGADFQESQQLAGGFFTNPNSGIIRFIAWFPLTAPTAMMLGLPMTEVPAIHIVGSLVTLLLQFR